MVWEFPKRTFLINGLTCVRCGKDETVDGATRLCFRCYRERKTNADSQRRVVKENLPP